jgi:hypothetical protein
MEILGGMGGGHTRRFRSFLTFLGGMHNGNILEEAHIFVDCRLIWVQPLLPPISYSQHIPHLAFLFSHEYLVADATLLDLFWFHTIHLCRYWYKYIRHTLFLV